MENNDSSSASVPDKNLPVTPAQTEQMSLRKQDDPNTAFTPAGAGTPVGWHIAVALGAGACVVALYFGLAAGTEKSSWLHAFLFERSFVQWVTLYVFFLGIGLLVERTLLYLRELKSFRLPREQQLRGDWITRVCRRFRRLKSAVDNRPPAEVHEYTKQLAEADASDLEFGYHVVGELIQILPLLGFFGTVLGLSRGLHRDFLSDLAQAATGIKSFVGAIGTAFDTTLLGLACTIVLIILQLLVRKREEIFLADLDRAADNFVARHCPPSAGGAGPADPAAQWRTPYAEHLQRLVVEVSGALRAELSKVPASMAEQFRTELSAAASRILEQSAQHQQATQQKIVSAASASLEASVNNIVTAIERQAVAWGALNDPLKQTLAEIRATVSALNKQDGEAARAMAAALSEQLQPFQRSLTTLAQEQGRTAEVVSNAFRDTTDRFCERVGEILSRPRRISIVDRPEDS
jgi:biopolymer transport protein ExbB/TolQ